MYEKFHIKNCYLCKNYVDQFYGGKLCTCYKLLKIDPMKHDTSRAIMCKYFRFNTYGREEIKKSENYHEVNYIELKTDEHTQS